MTQPQGGAVPSRACVPASQAQSVSAPPGARDPPSPELPEPVGSASGSRYLHEACCNVGMRAYARLTALQARECRTQELVGAGSTSCGRACRSKDRSCTTSVKCWHASVSSAESGRRIVPLDRVSYARRGRTGRRSAGPGAEECGVRFTLRDVRRRRTGYNYTSAAHLVGGASTSRGGWVYSRRLKESRPATAAQNIISTGRDWCADTPQDIRRGSSAIAGSASRARHQNPRAIVGARSGRQRSSSE